MPKSMDEIVSLAKRRGFVFQDSDIYGGQQGFWDYGPLGTLLKRNVRDAWWADLVGSHNELTAPAGAPGAFQMVGVETAIIMHPRVWKSSGHYDLFHDVMADCKGCKSRFRTDQVAVAAAVTGGGEVAAAEAFVPTDEVPDLSKTKRKRLDKKTGPGGEVVRLDLQSYTKKYPDAPLPACPACGGELTEPREFNLMFKTTLGALGGEDDAAFLRPETAQGMFVNFKNVVDSSRVKLPFGMAQVGKSFRNEITPRNFTFRSREFEQMEVEFFCRPDASDDWYSYWRDRRFRWYAEHGLSEENLILREHHRDELAHYSVGTADIEYKFPFLAEGEYGELEGVAHRGDFDLRSHSEGKLVNRDGKLEVELNDDGKPRHPGSGKSLEYFDAETKEKFVPHVIEPSAGADRATLAFLCEAYDLDEAPDDAGKMQSRTVLRFHPKLAPIKAAVFPLVKKDGMPERAAEIYGALKAAGLEAAYDQQGAVGRRYRRQDEIGTPVCVTVDGDTLTDGTVTVRDRDTLEQTRIPAGEVPAFVREKVG